VDSLKSKILWGLSLVAGAVLLAVLWPSAAADEAERKALAEGRTIIVYWDRLFGHEHRMRKVLIEEFNNSQSEVYVRTLPIGYYQAMEKILTSTAGGAPPDVCSLDTSLMAQLAAQGVLSPVEDFMAEVPALAADKFYPHCLDMSRMQGHLWGVPTSADVYCLLWNKNLFRKAGLDPERPPQTTDELLEYAAKLNVVSEDGQLKQMGIVPWVPWDLSHLWGSVFGGVWYDEATGRCELANDAGVIKGFEFQASFAQVPGAAEQKPWAVDPDRLQSFHKGLGEHQSANNPFYTGRVAMLAEGPWQVTFVKKYAPNLDWGVAALPAAPGVGTVGYVPVGMVDCIPSTSPNKEAAKKFLRWFYSPRPDGRPSPVSDFCHQVHNIPTRIEEANQERFIGNPEFKVFVDQMSAPKVVLFPVMPATQFMLDQAERQRERAVYGQITPAQAAANVANDTNRQLDRVRELAKRAMQ